MNNVIDLSYFILERCSNNGCPISHLQLQKLLFFLQKLNLEKKKLPLFNEKIYICHFGTVVKEVYNEFSVYSSLKIIPFDYNIKKSKITKIELEDFLLNYIDDFTQKKSWGISCIKNFLWEKLYNNGKGYNKLVSLEMMKNLF